MLLRTVPLLVAAGLLVACGSEDPTAEERTPSHSPTASAPDIAAPDDLLDATGGPDAAYVRWLGALESHDADAACRHHAPAFTIALRDEAIPAGRAKPGDPCTAFAARLWEDPERQYQPEDVEITHQTSEKATLAVAFPGDDETVELVRQRAAWLILNVRARTESTPNEPAQRWLDAWCELDPDMTRPEVVDLMGEPSGVYTVADGGEPQLYWTLREYDFRAYLDSDDPEAEVLELVGDYDALSAEDRARVDCPELR